MSNSRKGITLSAIVLSAVLSATAAAPTRAQDGPPQTIGTFMERDPATGAYTPLERSKYSEGTEAGYSMIGVVLGGGIHATGYYSFPGSHSPARFRSGDNPEFIVREASPDASAKLQFFRLKSVRDERRLI